MKKWLIGGLLIVVCSLLGCAGWHTKVNTVADKVGAWGMAIRQEFAPVIDAACSREVDRCVAAQDPECPGWQSCNTARRVVAESLQALQFAVLDAKRAALLGDQEDALRAAELAIDIVREITEQFRQMGIFPGGMGDGEE